MFDIGATTNVISEKLAHKLQLQFTGKRILIIQADGSCVWACRGNTVRSLPPVVAEKIFGIDAARFNNINSGVDMLLL